MPFFGAHMSIGGGLDQAVFDARSNGFDAVQIFSKNSNQWRAKPIEANVATQFHQAILDTGIAHPLIHDSYLINLASPKPDLCQKSIQAFTEELKRASLLQVPWVVMHPGAHTEDTPANGLQRISDSLNTIFADVPANVGVLLETTAGQGTYLGNRFEHLAEIRQKSSFADRLGVCFDTCHVFAAGYDFTTQEGYEQVFEEFDRIVGLEHLKAFHLNDSVKDLACHVDRHTHIGQGKIGLDAFRFLVNDPRFSNLPMYLETPKGQTTIDDQTVDWDTVNLQTLRNLMKENC